MNNHGNMLTPSPPPSSSIRTPPSPRFGYGDSWEPYSPRKSARISQQQSTANARTPSPASNSRAQLRSPRAAKINRSVASAAAMVSPTASPRKKRMPATDLSRRASGPLTTESTASAAAALGIDKLETRPASTSITTRAGMLPTPAKTPQKPPTDKNAANIKMFARNLFPAEDETVSSPRKRKPKKYTGISMDSFTAEEIDEPIEIFTDSQDRVPTIDVSSSNPFYGQHLEPVPEPTKRRSKRNRVVVPGEGSQTVDQALARDDGMVYVFRGKKIFRKFAQPTETVEEVQGAESTNAAEATFSRPYTRSSVKPRLLFPPQPKVSADILEDEEALTDVEDHVMANHGPETPGKVVEKAPETPAAPRFAAAMTPPDSRKAAHLGERDEEEATPVKKKIPGKRSPFDSWLRVKDPSASTSHKRHAEGLIPTATKKAKI